MSDRDLGPGSGHAPLARSGTRCPPGPAGWRWLPWWLPWLLPCLLWCGVGLASSEAPEGVLALERARFEAADLRLNAVYADVMGGLDAATADELRLDQRRWLERRDPYAAEVARLQGGVGAPADLEDDPWFWIARSERTESRTAVLEGWRAYGAGATDEAGWSGLWIDGYGGRLVILDEEVGRIAFGLFVVRGPTFHLGEIDGVAERMGRSARFATTSEWGDGETWLTFVAEGPRLRLWAENAQAFLGARAYFDGAYVRIGSVPEDERPALAARLEAHGASTPEP